MGTGTVASASLMTGWSIDRNKRSRQQSLTNQSTATSAAGSNR